jgi:hypothetical protein
MKKKEMKYMKKIQKLIMGLVLTTMILSTGVLAEHGVTGVPVGLTLSTDKSAYTIGQTVTFTLANNNTYAVVLPKNGFYVLDSNGYVVYNQAGTQTVTIPAHRKYQFEWKAATTPGMYPVHPGQHFAEWNRVETPYFTIGMPYVGSRCVSTKYAAC